MLVPNGCNHPEKRAYQHGVLDTIHNFDAVEEKKKKNTNIFVVVMKV